MRGFQRPRGIRWRLEIKFAVNIGKASRDHVERIGVWKLNSLLMFEKTTRVVKLGTMVDGAVRTARLRVAVRRVGISWRAMCRRLTERYTWREMHELYGLTGAARNLQAHYNVAPTHAVDVVKPVLDGTTELVSMRWGLIPYWWRKPLKYLPAAFNARVESVVDKPMFRDVFPWQRCIVPASGYYEWIARPHGMQPYYISAADGGTLSFAGLWDRWRNRETGERVMSCTIIVTDANALMRPIHDQMPVILEPAHFKAWLYGHGGAELLRSVTHDKLRIWPVSRRVNETGIGDDDPTLIDEVAA
jgi:putative SOS response-associated peptidase YedK